MIPMPAAASAPTAAVTSSSPATAAPTRPSPAIALFGAVSRLMRLTVEVRLIRKIAAAFDRQRRRRLLLPFGTFSTATFRRHLRTLLFQNRLAR